MFGEKYCEITPCYDVSSDHSPLVVNLLTDVLPSHQSVYNKSTNWETFREILKSSLITNVPLKTEMNIEQAIVYYNDTIIDSAVKSTPPQKLIREQSALPNYIKVKVKEKRKLRPDIQATAKLKVLLKEHDDYKSQCYLLALTPTVATDYSLWKATKRLSNNTSHNPLKYADGSCSKTNKERAEILAKYLEGVFTETDDSGYEMLPVAYSSVNSLQLELTTCKEISFYITKTTIMFLKAISKIENSL